MFKINRKFRSSYNSLAVAAVSSVLVSSSSPVKANLKVDLPEMGNNLELYDSNKDKFEKLLDTVKTNFYKSHGNLVEEDTSFSNVDPRIQYMIYVILGSEIEQIPALKNVLEMMVIVKGKKLTLKEAKKGENKKNSMAYCNGKFSISVSPGDQRYSLLVSKPLRQDFEKDIIIEKINKGERLDESNDYSRKADSHASNRMLSATKLKGKELEAAFISNTIMHETGHLFQYCLCTVMGTIDWENVIEKYGLHKLVEDSNSIGTSIENSRKEFQNEGYLKYNSFGRIMTTCTFLDAAKDTQRYEYLFGDCVGLESDLNSLCDSVCEWEDTEDGLISYRGRDNETEYAAEIFVYAFGVGGCENNWGKAYRKFLKSILGPDCLGIAGQDWTN